MHKTQHGQATVTSTSRLQPVKTSLLLEPRTSAQETQQGGGSRQAPKLNQPAAELTNNCNSKAALPSPFAAATAAVNVAATADADADAAAVLKLGSDAVWQQCNHQGSLAGHTQQCVAQQGLWATPQGLGVSQQSPSMSQQGTGLVQQNLKARRGFRRGTSPYVLDLSTSDPLPQLPNVPAAATAAAAVVATGVAAAENGMRGATPVATSASTTMADLPSAPVVEVAVNSSLCSAAAAASVHDVVLPASAAATAAAEEATTAAPAAVVAAMPAAAAATVVPPAVAAAPAAAVQVCRTAVKRRISHCIGTLPKQQFLPAGAAEVAAPRNKAAHAVLGPRKKPNMSSSGFSWSAPVTDVTGALEPQSPRMLLHCGFTKNSRIGQLAADAATAMAMLSCPMPVLLSNGELNELHSLHEQPDYAAATSAAGELPQQHMHWQQQQQQQQVQGSVVSSVQQGLTLQQQHQCQRQQRQQQHSLPEAVRHAPGTQWQHVPAAVAATPATPLTAAMLGSSCINSATNNTPLQAQWDILQRRTSSNNITGLQQQVADLLTPAARHPVAQHACLSSGQWMFTQLPASDNAPAAAAAAAVSQLNSSHASITAVESVTPAQARQQQLKQQQQPLGEETMHQDQQQQRPLDGRILQQPSAIAPMHHVGMDQQQQQQQTVVCHEQLLASELVHAGQQAGHLQQEAQITQLLQTHSSNGPHQLEQQQVSGAAMSPNSQRRQELQHQQRLLTLQKVLKRQQQRQKPWVVQLQEAQLSEAKIQSLSKRLQHQQSHQFQLPEVLMSPDLGLEVPAVMQCAGSRGQGLAGLGSSQHGVLSPQHGHFLNHHMQDMLTADLSPEALDAAAHRSLAAVIAEGGFRDEILEAQGLGPGIGDFRFSNALSPGSHGVSESVCRSLQGLEASRPMSAEVLGPVSSRLGTDRVVIGLRSKSSGASGNLSLRSNVLERTPHPNSSLTTTQPADVFVSGGIVEDRQQQQWQQQVLSRQYHQQRMHQVKQQAELSEELSRFLSTDGLQYMQQQERCQLFTDTLLLSPSSSGVEVVAAATASSSIARQSSDELLEAARELLKLTPSGSVRTGSGYKLGKQSAGIGSSKQVQQHHGRQSSLEYSVLPQQGSLQYKLPRVKSEGLAEQQQQQVGQMLMTPQQAVQQQQQQQLTSILPAMSLPGGDIDSSLCLPPTCAASSSRRTSTGVGLGFQEDESSLPLPVEGSNLHVRPWQQQSYDPGRCSPLLISPAVCALQLREDCAVVPAHLTSEMAAVEKAVNSAGVAVAAAADTAVTSVVSPFAAFASVPLARSESSHSGSAVPAASADTRACYVAMPNGSAAAAAATAAKSRAAIAEYKQCFVAQADRGPMHQQGCFQQQQQSCRASGVESIAAATAVGMLHHSYNVPGVVSANAVEAEQHKKHCFKQRMKGCESPSSSKRVLPRAVAITSQPQHSAAVAAACVPTAALAGGVTCAPQRSAAGHLVIKIKHSPTAAAAAKAAAAAASPRHISTCRITQGSVRKHRLDSGELLSPRAAPASKQHVVCSRNAVLPPSPAAAGAAAVAARADSGFVDIHAVMGVEHDEGLLLPAMPDDAFKMNLGPFSEPCTITLPKPYDLRVPGDSMDEGLTVSGCSSDAGDDTPSGRLLLGSPRADITRGLVGLTGLGSVACKAARTAVNGSPDSVWQKYSQQQQQQQQAQQQQARREQKPGQHRRHRLKERPSAAAGSAQVNSTGPGCTTSALQRMDSSAARHSNGSRVAGAAYSGGQDAIAICNTAADKTVSSRGFTADGDASLALQPCSWGGLGSVYSLDKLLQQQQQQQERWLRYQRRRASRDHSRSKIGAQPRASTADAAAVAIASTGAVVAHAGVVDTDKVDKVGLKPEGSNAVSLPAAATAASPAQAKSIASTDSLVVWPTVGETAAKVNGPQPALYELPGCLQLGVEPAKQVVSKGVVGSRGTNGGSSSSTGERVPAAAAENIAAVVGNGCSDDSIVAATAGGVECMLVAAGSGDSSNAVQPVPAELNAWLA